MPKTKFHNSFNESKQPYEVKEPIPQTTDGSYRGAKKFSEKLESKNHDEFLKEFDRAKAILKTQPVSITHVGDNLYLQWTSYQNFDDSPSAEGIRHKKSFGALTGGKFSLTRESVQRALKIALEISEKINCGKFSWLDYWQWIPEDKRPNGLNATTKLVSELIEEYKQHFFDTHGTELKHEENWRNKVIFLNNLVSALPLTDHSIKKALTHYQPHTASRNTAFFVIKAFCEHFDYKFDFEPYRESAKYTPKKKKEISDELIIESYNLIKNHIPGHSKYKSKFYSWFYGVMATYGLRNHEVLNIKNLFTDYIDDTGYLFPALLNSTSEKPIIYTTGKTGERMQPLPMYPEWVDLFDLRNVPDFPSWFFDESLTEKQKEIKKKTLGDTIRRVMRSSVKLPFQLYNLRHAYALRCRSFRFSPIDVSDFMGHSLEEHNKTYNSSISHATKNKNAENAIKQINDERSEKQIFEDKIAKLEAENAFLREQNERLQLELRIIREIH